MDKPHSRAEAHGTLEPSIGSIKMLVKQKKIRQRSSESVIAIGISTWGYCSAVDWYFSRFWTESCLNLGRPHVYLEPSILRKG